MNKHFELTDETIDHDGYRTLYRIRATRDLPHHHVKAGDLGGYVESLKNLSDNAWVEGDSRVIGNAQVTGNALVYGDAWVDDDAMVYDNARVCDNALVYDNARVFGNARVSRNAQVSNKSWVTGNAMASGDARVSGNALLTDNAMVTDNARVTDDAEVLGDTHAFGNALLSGKARVADNTHIMIGTLYTIVPLDWTLHRTAEGHILHIGRKSGTIDDHQTICDSDSWIEDNEPDTIRAARSEYQAIIDLCRTRVARWNH